MRATRREGYVSTLVMQEDRVRFTRREGHVSTLDAREEITVIRFLLPLFIRLCVVCSLSLGFGFRPLGVAQDQEHAVLTRRDVA